MDMVESGGVANKAEFVETFFSHSERMFPELENGKIPTKQFLSACQGIADFVSFLGVAFIPVEKDISGNVHKVHLAYETDTTKFFYLEDLIDIDIANNNGKLTRATEGLLWLKRGLEFMLEFLSAMVETYRSSVEKSKSESLRPIINRSYEATLQRHHGTISRQLFKVVAYAAPNRGTVLKLLAEGREGLDEVCIAHIDTHRDNFRNNVVQLVNYYITKNLD